MINRDPGVNGHQIWVNGGGGKGPDGSVWCRINRGGVGEG